MCERWCKSPKQRRASGCSYVVRPRHEVVGSRAEDGRPSVVNYSLITRYDLQADTSFAVGKDVTIQRRPPMPLGSASNSLRPSWSQETLDGAPN